MNYIKNFEMVLSNTIGNRKGELAMSTILGIAIAIIVAAFVLIPQIRSFAATILSDVQSWWTNTVRNSILVSS